MKLVFGSLHLKIKHTYIRDGRFYFQRAVPGALKGRYPGATIKRNLNTSDPIKAAKMVDQLVRAYDAEWAGLLAAPDSSPTALTVHADDFLKRFGLAPHGANNDEDALAQLHDYIELKRARYANGDERTYREAETSDYLSPVEIEAGRRLHGARKATIQDVLKVYLETHRNRGVEKFKDDSERVIGHLISVTGDKAIQSFTRADARNYVETCLEQESKTATVRRRLNTLTAIWNAYRLERDPATVNPFESLAVPGEGTDATQRIPHTPAELAQLYAACRVEDDDMRWIVAMAIDTGTRIGEVVGLAMDDIKLEADVPHIILRPHPWRSIKKQARAIRAPVRSVPLVGASLWAARRVVDRAPDGQKLAFPRYTDETQCRATHASNALNKWVRGLGIDHVMHELRHSLKDRLRDVQCPKEIMDSILGHGKADVGDQYGLGYKLPVKLEWMERVATSTPGSGLSTPE